MTQPGDSHTDVPDFDPTASSLAGHIAPEIMTELLSMRSSIDNIDAALVYLLAERFKATQRVGFLKAAHRLPPADPGRETAQIARLRALAASAHLDPAFAEKFLNFIISEVIRHHQDISDNHSASQDGVQSASQSARQGGPQDSPAGEPGTVQEPVNGSAATAW
jgi:chorismate mutase